jgi:hypothetical protein
VASPKGDVQQVSGSVDAIAGPPSPASTIAFQTFDDDVGAQAVTENRTLIRSASGYQAFFGHAAPAEVDFSSQWVMFYAAGTKPTSGYEAKFLAVLRAGGSLIAITELASPGAGCGTAQALSTPYTLVRFAAQVGTTAQFFRQDDTLDCPTGLCAAVLCPAGSDCDPTTGKCVPGPIRCGGIAGLACPGVGRCVDDPTDGCDPKAGGADCGGICQCPQSAVCPGDSRFDNSPSVCACVPACGSVCDIYCQYGTAVDANGCPTCTCNPDPCATVKCASGTHCDSGKCVPDPVVCPPVCAIACQFGNVLDANGCPTCACNPNPCGAVLCAPGTHCDSGKCLSDGVACGGIAGKACPGFGKCVDDPNDSCDPNAGGADCAGICTCGQNVSCAVNTRFDSSPSVCTCVPVSSGACPPEKCPSPGPKVASTKCADGTVAGPTCALAADGTCGWTIVTCPATAP